MRGRKELTSSFYKISVFQVFFEPESGHTTSKVNTSLRARFWVTVPEADHHLRSSILGVLRDVELTCPSVSMWR